MYVPITTKSKDCIIMLRNVLVLYEIPYYKLLIINYNHLTHQFPVLSRDV